MFLWLRMVGSSRRWPARRRRSTPRCAWWRGFPGAEEARAAAAVGSVRDLRRSLATETLADEAAGATTAAVGSFTFGEQDLGAIREALARLVAQGFVQSQAFTGFRVTGLSPVDLQELTDARADLEGLVLRRSVEEGDLAWGSQVLAGHHTLARTTLYEPADPDRVSDTWFAAHTAFHSALLAGCGTARLRLLAADLRDATAIYQAWSQQQGRNPGRDAAGEQRELKELALARRALEAAEALRRHIWRTTEILLASAPSGVAGRPGPDATAEEAPAH